MQLLLVAWQVLTRQDVSMASMEAAEGLLSVEAAPAARVQTTLGCVYIHSRVVLSLIYLHTLPLQWWLACPTQSSQLRRQCHQSSCGPVADGVN